MHPFTHHGFDDDPARYTPPDPIFPLQRKPPHGRPTEGDDAFELRNPLPPAWPFPNELDREAFAMDDEDDARLVPRFASARSIAVRIVGLLVLAAALVGCGTVLARPEAQREALGWATLGHAQTALDAAGRAASAARGLLP